MRGFKLIFVAAAMAFAGNASAQDAAPVASIADVTPAESAATVAGLADNVAGVGTRPDPALGQPLGRRDVQPQVTLIGQQAAQFNTALLIIMGVISIVVFGLLFWANFRFARVRNPVASRTSHNTFVEVVWTLVPVLVLVGIAIPSFKLLAAQYDPPAADVTIKATGHQWYWSYEYPDQGGFGFDSVMLTDEEAAAAGEPLKLATDNRIVVPVGETVKVLVTAADVLHSWAMPAFWVKMDAVPGKINETWFRAEKPGLYYGQCSELCGTKHGFMPIAVEVVSRPDFDAWVARRQADAGIVSSTPESDSGTMTTEPAAGSDTAAPLGAVTN